jgi:hypothetical protein
VRLSGVQAAPDAGAIALLKFEGAAGLVELLCERRDLSRRRVPKDEAPKFLVLPVNHHLAQLIPPPHWASSRTFQVGGNDM